MKRSLILCVLAIFVAAGLVAQERAGQNAVVDFSRGLVTAKNPLTQGFDEASKAWNIDFTRNPGELGPRLGYSERCRMPLIDSFLWNGIFVAQYRDGTKEFMGIGKWEDSAWAGIFVSDPNKFGFGVTDIIVLRPDTATINDSLQSSGDEEFDLTLVISAGGYQSSVTIGGFVLYDESTTPADIVDTFVARINASSVAPYVTAVDLGDSLSISEDSAYQVAVVGTGMSPTGAPTHSLGEAWIQRIDSTVVDSASVVATRFPATGSPRFAQFRDQVYIVNGVGRGGIRSKGGWREWPMRAPGEPSIVPTTDSAAPSGTYKYALKFADPEADSLLNRLGTLSGAVSSGNGAILMYSWPVHNADAWEVDSSFYLEIWRTLGTVGALNEDDYVYLVDSILIDGDAEALTIEYTDTTSDATLHGRDSTKVALNWDDTTFGTGCYYAPETTGDAKPTLAVAPGAPTILSGTDLTASVGIWANGDDTLSWPEVVGFAWMVVPADTALNIVGDSSRSMRLCQKVSTLGYTNQYNVDSSVNSGFKRNLFEKVTLVLPRGPASIRYDVYRAPVMPVSMDSTRTVWSGGGMGPIALKRWWYEGKILETPAFYFIGQYNPGDTVRDSLSYDSLTNRDVYKRSAVPEKMFDIVSAANRLIAVDDQSVYMSDPVDSMVRFSVLQQRMVAPDNGDRNTGIWESGQGVVKVAKTNSLYDLYRSNGLWQLPSLSKYYGMVAPLSHAKAPEGDYFLALDGVRLESEGIYKDRSFTGTLMSSPLKNFEELDASVMRTSIGIYHDNKYILSFPSLDTSFVLNKVMRDGQPSFGWSEWSLCPVGATKYRVSDDNTIMPGDSLYFILSGDPRIYSWGNSDYDNGRDVYWEWQSGPSNPVTGNLWYPNSIALYLNSTESNDYTYSLSFLNDRGVGHGLLTNRLDTANWHEFDATDTLGESGALYWRVRLYRNILFSDTGTTSIQGMWFNVNPKERYGAQ